MSQKIGRNDPCPCGSAKKYKRCCIDKKANFPTQEELMHMFHEIELKKLIQKEKLKSLGILINCINPLIHLGHKVWIIGRRLYYNRPRNETFHEFIVFVLQVTLGKEWFDAEAQKPKIEQHHIFRCFVEHGEWSRRNGNIPENQVNETIWGAKPDGWSIELLSLAFDVASLQHTEKLPNQLINSLKDFNEYQGARYEIMVAAVFARLGFDIVFFDAKKRGAKHCEFIATHRESGFKIAVEAKSRHRAGVLHQEGIKNDQKILKGDIGTLFNQAMQKDEVGKMPFAVFVDVNTPNIEDKELFEKKWSKGIEKFLRLTGVPTPTNPDLFSVAHFTNFSYHYQQDGLARSGEHFAVRPLFPKYPVPQPFLDMIQLALNNYGRIPLILPDGNIMI